MFGRLYLSPGAKGVRGLVLVGTEVKRLVFPLSQCVGKTPYFTEGGVEAGRKYMEQCSGVPYRHYDCEVCGAKHLTSKGVEEGDR